MKRTLHLTFGLWAVMNLGCALLARAEPCRIEGHEADLSGFYEKSVRQLLATLPKKAGFAMDPETLEMKTEATTSFLLNENHAQPVLELSGSFRSTTGTDFTFTVQTRDSYYSTETEQVHVLPSEGEILFSSKLLSAGSDRQGNPLHPRCRLTTDSWLSVINEKWKRTVAKFTLPATVTINLEEK